MFALRPYQGDLGAVGAFEKFAPTYRKLLLEMATGTGKTRIAGELLKRTPERGIFLCPANLAKQSRKAIEIFTDEAVGLELAGLKSHGERLVVASVETLRDGRFERFDPRGFSLVIADEAHGSIAAGYLRIINHFLDHEPCRLVGLTATPLRTDEQTLGVLYDALPTPNGAAFSYPICAATNDGWLAPIVSEVVRIESINLDEIKTKTKKADFSDAEIERRFLLEKHLDAVVRPTLERATGKGMLTVCYSPGVTHAIELANHFNAVSGERIAEPVYGTTGGGAYPPIPTRRRDEIVYEEFPQGKIKILCNYGVLTTGWDCPNCRAMVLCRPTKSELLLTQMLGRITRTHGVDLNEIDTPESRRAAILASPKPSALVLDFTGRTSTHRLVGVEDVLGGEYSDEVKEYAKRKPSEGESEGKPVAEILEQAELELALAREIEDREAAEKAAEQRRKRVRVNYSTFETDMYGGGGAGVGAGRVGDSGRPQVVSAKWMNFISLLAVRAGKDWGPEFFNRVGRSKSLAFKVTSELKEELGWSDDG